MREPSHAHASARVQMARAGSQRLGRTDQRTWRGQVDFLLQDERGDQRRHRLAPSSRRRPALLSPHDLCTTGDDEHLCRLPIGSGAQAAPVGRAVDGLYAHRMRTRHRWRERGQRAKAELSKGGAIECRPSKGKSLSPFPIAPLGGGSGAIGGAIECTFAAPHPLGQRTTDVRAHTCVELTTS